MRNCCHGCKKESLFLLCGVVVMAVFGLNFFAFSRRLFANTRFTAPFHQYFNAQRKDVVMPQEYPSIATGPPTDLYVRHQTNERVFTKVFDSTNCLPWQETSPKNLLCWGKYAPLFESWKGLSSSLHKRLRDENLETVSFVTTPEVLSRFPFEAFPTQSRKDTIMRPCRKCVWDPRLRPVVDIALVIPMVLDGLRFKVAWKLLESLQHQTVWPKEVFLAIGSVKSPRDDFLLAFFHLLKQYVKSFPRETRVMAYASEVKTSEGENRWLGLNRTSASIVANFDSDDYLHPQFFEIFWQIFSQRPELHHALMAYGGSVDDKVTHPTDRVIEPIVKYLKDNRRFTSEDVKKAIAYSENEYVERVDKLSKWGKTWWLGNTDAEPNWGVQDAEGKVQEWYDYGCANGWQVFRRRVMELIPMPVAISLGADSIWNYRVTRANLNSRCFAVPLGLYIPGVYQRSDHLRVNSDG